EKQAGAQVLDTLINEELIHQETANKKVSVSQGELDKEVASIKKVVESQGQNLEDVLTTQGLSLVDFKEQVRIQIALEKLLKDQVSVTDEEINKYLEENKETIPQDLSKKKARQAVQDQLKTQKLNQAVQALIEKLQKDASISHFVGY
ncbi:MAG: SurA N-terminal domain-containing protein, partial [Candidatus Paceibacterota bacterium]